MTDDAAYQEILSFNFHYLSLLQRHLLADPLRARYTFHLDEKTASLLATLDSHQLLTLSNTQRLLCDFTLGEPEQLERRLQAPEHLQDAYRVQTIILKASRRRDTQRPQMDYMLWGDHS